MNYAQLLEKATILSKHDHKIMIKFIKGLPDLVSIYVTWILLITIM